MAKPHHKIDLLLTNARVLTLDSRRPTAQAVAISGENIVAVGDRLELNRLRGPRTRVIDCRGLTLIPGIVDAHCHLLAMAASLTGLDCGPEAVGSIRELKDQLQRRARQTPPGGWLRGFGYDHLSLAEGRHPTRQDLDEAAPRRLVRLDHRSGHASALNTLALEAAGIRANTPDPIDGVIERDESTGEPTGLLLEMASFLRQRLGSRRDESELAEGVRRLSRTLLGYGITSAQDAGPDNDPERWRAFQRVKASGQLVPRVTMLAGARHLEEFRAAGLGWRDGDDHLRLGPAKVMLTLTTGALHPPAEELQQLVSDARRRGFPVAIHAIEQEAIAAGAEAIARASPLAERPGSRRGQPAALDRIEHCAEGPPQVLSKVLASGAMVVTQPGFLFWNGDRYLDTVEPALLPHLYPLGALSNAGIPLAFGSDGPVIGCNPWPGIYSAVTGATRSGKTLPGAAKGTSEHLMSVESALRAYTLGGAGAEGSSARKGTISPGKLADLVLLDADPITAELCKLKKVRAALTVLGGRVVWSSGV